MMIWWSDVFSCAISGGDTTEGCHGHQPFGGHAGTPPAGCGGSEGLGGTGGTPSYPGKTMGDKEDNGRFPWEYGGNKGWEGNLETIWWEDEKKALRMTCCFHLLWRTRMGDWANDLRNSTFEETKPVEFWVSKDHWDFKQQSWGFGQEQIGLKQQKQSSFVTWKQWSQDNSSLRSYVPRLVAICPHTNQNPNCLGISNSCVLFASPNSIIFPQQRKLMGSSAQNSSGVHWCRRRVRFNRVSEKVPEKVPGSLVQSQVKFNRFRRRLQKPSQVR